MTNIEIVEIKVSAFPGADYHFVFKEMIELAMQTRCPVVFETPRGQLIRATEWSTVTWMMQKYFP